MKHRSAWLIVPLALTFSIHASAQSTDLERARALYDEAGEAERAGRWGVAQDRLRAAIRIHETPHLRYALGWALENDGRSSEAQVEYRTALDLARASNNEEVSQLASARLEALERKGRPVARHSTPSPVTTEAPRGGGVVPWLLVGGGAVLGVTGVALLVASGSDTSDRDENKRRWCEATACTDGATATVPETSEASDYRAAAVRAADRANEKQILGGVFIGAGIASAVVGTVLIVHEHNKSEAGRTKASLGAAPLPGGASVSALLRF